MPKPGRWRNDPERRAHWKKNQKAKRDHVRPEHHGPKYSEYFYAYSNRMLASAVEKPLCTAHQLGGSIGEELLRYGNLVQLELPLVGSDDYAKYGLLFVPRHRMNVLRDLGAPHRKVQLGRRIMHSQDQDIAVLDDHWLPKGWRAEMVAEDFAGLEVLAYREPFSATPISEYLKHERFCREMRIEYGMKLLPGRRASKAKEESGKPLHFNFYRIPLVRGPVIDVQSRSELDAAEERVVPAYKRRYLTAGDTQ